MEEFITKADKRANKRKSKEKKWIKHSYWENWGKSQGWNLTKWLKKLLKIKIK